ncbi:MAG: ATP-binding protein [Acidimicrobiia bacterium]
MQLRALTDHRDKLPTLQTRVLQLRAVAYALGTVVALAITLSQQTQRATAAAAVLAIALLSTLTLKRDRFFALELTFVVDAMVALAFAFLFGPVAGVDFMLFYVVATAALLLPTIRAIRVAVVAITSELLLIPLQLVDRSVGLPLMHPAGRIGEFREFFSGVGVRAALIAITALLFISIARMLQGVQQARRESDERYRLLFHRTPIPIWEEDFTELGDWFHELWGSGVSDLRAHLGSNPEALLHGIGLLEVTGVNDAAVALFEAEWQDKLLGRHHPETVVAETASAYLEQFVALWEGQDRIEVEIKAASLKGQRIEGILHCVVPRVGGRLDLSRVVVAIADVTELKRTQEHLEELVRSKDELIASVSHELRTPLTAVVGLAQELRDRSSDLGAAERSELIEILADQSEEVSNIVEDLLVAARVETGNLAVSPQVIDLREQIQTVVADRSISGSETGVQTAIEDGTAMAWGDPRRVRQILRNLLINAIRYGGGQVRVHAGHSALGAWVRVTDNGPGVPSEDRDAIFEPYHRSHLSEGQPGSLGLGLAVSRKLARLMEGDLTYADDDGESTFELTLPSPTFDQVTSRLSASQEAKEELAALSNLPPDPSPISMGG